MVGLAVAGGVRRHIAEHRIGLLAAERLDQQLRKAMFDGRGNIGGFYRIPDCRMEPKWLL
jgi:hypothetical protein